MENKKYENLGITSDMLCVHRDISSLIQSTPLYVNAKAVRDSSLNVDGENVEIRRSENYVMPLGIYNNCRRSTGLGNNRTVYFKPSKTQFKDVFKRFNACAKDKKGKFLDFNNSTILVSRVGGIGDIMFSQPVCKTIKKKWPTCKIVYACSPRYTSLLKMWGDVIDRIETIPMTVDKFKSYDYHLMFEGCIERCYESHNLDAYDIFMKAAGFQYGEIYNAHIENLLGMEVDEDYARRICVQLPYDFNVIQVKASSPIRMFSESKWLEILKRLQDETKENFILLDSSKYTQEYDNLLNYFSLNPKRFKNGCPYSNDLIDAVHIMSRAKSIIGIDSSLAHIAASFDKPILGLFGSFRGNLRYSHYKNAHVVSCKECECGKMPCFFHGDEGLMCEDLVNKRYPVCMESISNDEIIDTFKTMLNLK